MKPPKIELPIRPGTSGSFARLKPVNGITVSPNGDKSITLIITHGQTFTSHRMGIKAACQLVNSIRAFLPKAKGFKLPKGWLDEDAELGALE